MGFVFEKNLCQMLDTFQAFLRIQCLFSLVRRIYLTFFLISSINHSFVTIIQKLRFLIERIVSKQLKRKYYKNITFQIGGSIFENTHL